MHPRGRERRLSRFATGMSCLARVHAAESRHPPAVQRWRVPCLRLPYACLVRLSAPGEDYSARSSSPSSPSLSGVRASLEPSAAPSRTARASTERRSSPVASCRPPARRRAPLTTGRAPTSSSPRATARAVACRRSRRPAAPYSLRRARTFARTKGESPTRAASTATVPTPAPTRRIHRRPRCTFPTAVTSSATAAQAADAGRAPMAAEAVRSARGGGNAKALSVPRQSSVPRSTTDAIVK